MERDMIFLPGVIHGAPNQLYVCMYNADGNEGKGSYDLDKVWDDDIIEAYEKSSGNHTRFFDILEQASSHYLLDNGDGMFNCIERNKSDAVTYDYRSEAEMRFMYNWATKNKIKGV